MTRKKILFSFKIHAYEAKYQIIKSLSKFTPSFVLLANGLLLMLYLSEASHSIRTFTPVISYVHSTFSPLSLWEFKPKGGEKE